LGKQFPSLLLEAGIAVEKHSDHFLPDAKDEDWLIEVGRQDWFCLTHDRRIRYKPNEIDAVMRAGVGLFVLVGKATHAELAENFIATIHKVENFIERTSRPFVAKIHRPASAKGRFSSKKVAGSVALWRSYDNWSSR